jgi:cell division protein ZapE
MSLLAAYDALITSGELRPDPEQRAAAVRLGQLQSELEAVPPRGSLLWRLAGRKPDAPRGIYMWGGVGRGKSMLMDLFYDNLAIERKRRVHFHEFMQDIHARLRVERDKAQGDPIPPVAAALKEQARCIAFDEMVVNNSADAMIMSRLFTALITSGVTIVATSNRPPVDLYKDGLNREHFLPFIALIGDRLDVLGLNGPTDYRRDRLGDGARWFVPADDIASAALASAFFRLTDYPPEDRSRSRRRPHPACAEGVEGRRGFLVQEAVWAGARRGRLSGGGAAIPYRDHRRHPAHGAREPQRGGAFRDADRRALRI